MPSGYDNMETFYQLLLIRSWCPDRFIPMAKDYIAEILGDRYTDEIITNLEELYQESDNRTPMICFLSTGSDPTDNIEKLAKKNNLSASMGLEDVMEMRCTNPNHRRQCPISFGGIIFT